MPMSGVSPQLLPLHGELSTKSLAPAANTAGWFASMASPGSFEPLGRYGVLGLPTVTLLSADTALAGVEMARAASSENATGMPKRRTVIGFLPLEIGRSIPSASRTSPGFTRTPRSRIAPNGGGATG